mgnify:CR=1 FL=1|nr:MAG TPA: hypothetical protein [Herelleviridae sp.]
MEGYYVYRFDIAEQHNGRIDKVNVEKILGGFSCLEDCESILNTVAWYLDDEDNTYLVIEFEDNEPVGIAGVYFVNDGEGFMDVAEHDFRVIASVAFGTDWV